MNNIHRAIEHLSKNDIIMSELIRNYGIFKIKPHKKYFFALLRAITEQQLSIKVAKSINRKFMSYFKYSPTPEKILNTDNKILRELGLSNAKVKYIKDLSEKIISRQISLKEISKKNRRRNYI